MKEKHVFPGVGFPLIMAVFLAILLALLGLQVALLDTESGVIEGGFEYVEDPEHVDVRVAVGEAYFIQQNSDLPDDVIEVRVGDVVRFYNEGSIAHTVTVDRVGLDEFMSPGDEIYVVFHEPFDKEVLDCTLHSHHEGVISVFE